MRLKRAERRYRLTTRDYAQLAGFRYALRGFMRFSEAAAEEAGLTSKHYQVMLVLRARTEDGPVSINDIAQQLLIKHNSAVGLVDRLEEEKLVVRTASQQDRRKVELRLTGRGRQVLAKLAAVHRNELQRIAPYVKRFFGDLESVQAVGPGSGRTAKRGA